LCSYITLYANEYHRMGYVKAQLDALAVIRERITL
jgi:hypothetical protein